MKRAVNISPLRALWVLLEGDVDNDRTTPSDVRDVVDDAVEVVVAAPILSSDLLKARDTRTVLARVRAGSYKYETH